MGTSKTASASPALALDHLGIAVRAPQELQKLFGILGLAVTHRERVEEQGVDTHFLELPPVTAHLELLEPFDAQSTIAKFLEKRGPGIHHLAFRVPRGRLDPLSVELAQAGYRLIYPEAREGAHQMRVNFIHPATAGGLLIEIMEPRGG